MPGGLLSAQDALLNGQTVEINGTILVDLDYTFSTGLGGTYNEITMSHGARIEVLSPYKFGILNANVHGCGGSWDRIFVHSGGEMNIRYVTISDAEVAVELDDDTHLILSGVEFIGNDIGVGTFGVNQHNVDIDFFTGNGFNDLFINFINGSEGIHLENTNDVNINGIVSYWDMTENGIYLDNTDLTCFLNLFLNCDVGINVATPNSLLSVDYNSFQDCSIGINTVGTNDLIVTNSSFSSDNNPGTGIGINRRSAQENERTEIENNVFTVINQGINASMLPSNGFVQYNNFYSNRSFNVSLNGIGSGEHAWAIQRNPNMEVASSVSGLFNSNVFLRNTRKAAIFRNDDVITALNAKNFTISGGGKQLRWLQRRQFQHQQY